MMNTINRIEALDEYEVLDFFEYFSQKIFVGLDKDYSLKKDAITNVPNAIRNTDSFAQIEKLASENIQNNLDPEQSVLIARKVLLALATDKTFETILSTALNEYSGDEDLGDFKIIQAGVAVSMVLLTATTKVKANVFDIEIEKTTPKPELVDSLMKPAAAILTAVAAKEFKQK